MSPPRKFDHDDARKRYAAGESQAALAREYGVSQTAVSRAVNPKVRERLDAASVAYHRDRRTPCLGGCGALVWTYARAHVSGYCRTCLGVLQRTAEHGTEAYYKNRRCRCDACRTASAAARRDHRHRNIEATRAYDRERKRQEREARKAAA